MSMKDAQAKVEELPPLLDISQAEGIAMDADVASDTGHIADSDQSEAANDGDTAMETIRDLLFGDVVKSLRRELHLTVRNLRGTIKVVHREFKQRADELSDQISALQLALDNEAVEREALATALAGQIEHNSDHLQSKLIEQTESMEVLVKQLGTDIELHSNQQEHAMGELEQKLFAALEEYTAEFRDGKMNRNEFAEMLATLAGKVNADR